MWLPYMIITRSPLSQNHCNFTLPFFGGSYPIVLLDNTYQLFYMYINWFDWIIFSMIVYVIQKLGGDKNYPNSLNVMVNYHCHGENRIIIR